jgi:hypothetical protein
MVTFHSEASPTLKNLRAAAKDESAWPAGLRIWETFGRRGQFRTSDPSGPLPGQLLQQVILGLHLKGVDLLRSIQMLQSDLGSFGCALILTRSLFEVLVNARYILRSESEAKATAFVAHSLVRTYSLAAAPISPAKVHEQEHKAQEFFADLTNVSMKRSDYGTYWAPDKIYAMATQVGLGHVYENFYRAAAQAAHGLDAADVYNPMYHWAMQVGIEAGLVSTDQFLSNYAVYDSQEMIGALLLPGYFGWALFGETAQFMGVELTADERVEVEQAGVHLDKATVAYDDAAWQEAVERLRELK